MKRISLDDLEEAVRQDSGQNDGATFPGDLNEWMEEQGEISRTSWAIPDAATELFETGSVTIRLNGKSYLLSLVVEEA